VDVGHPDLSLRRQCELLGLSRASLYYAPVGEEAEDLAAILPIEQAVHFVQPPDQRLGPLSQHLSAQEPPEVGARPQVRLPGLVRNDVQVVATVLSTDPSDDPDLILVDLMLPDMTGMQLAAELRSNEPLAKRAA